VNFSRGAVIGPAALHAVLFAAFFSQEILIDSSRCDVSCGNLVVDLILIALTPLSWLATVSISTVAFFRARELRRVCTWCLAVVGATTVIFIGTLIYPALW
jgi:hypothetical protein